MEAKKRASTPELAVMGRRLAYRSCNKYNNKRCTKKIMFMLISYFLIKIKPNRYKNRKILLRIIKNFAKNWVFLQKENRPIL